MLGAPSLLDRCCSSQPTPANSFDFRNQRRGPESGGAQFLAAFSTLQFHMENSGGSVGPNPMRKRFHNLPPEVSSGSSPLHPFPS